jgi:ubiquinone/menaquinone biosynthesis C-methylase UbiE
MLDQIPPHRAFDAVQAFVLDSELFRTRQKFPELRRRHEAAAAAAGTPPRSADEVAALIGDDTTARFFGRFGRHQQRREFSGRHGRAVHCAQHRDTIAAALAEPLPEGMLQLDPGFRLPDYYTSIDIHQHHGVVWSDAIAGFVHTRGAQSSAPFLDRAESLHDRLAATALARAGRPVARVADLGCGFGASTRPYYADHPEMEVVGVELSEPCLRLAARDAAAAQARNVTFRQADAADTGLAAGGFDVVTSTMLLHEMPPRHIARVLAESHRLLVPGGVSVHLDFLAHDEPFRESGHLGHPRRNSERFMAPINAMDLEAAHRDAGFEAVEILPFEEFTGALAPDMTAWRFPWTLIVARKPA